MIQRILRPLTEPSYALLRVLAGAMFAFHGAQKIFGVFTSSQPAPWSQLWFGGLIELIGGGAIALGLFTSWAAFLCSGTMAVAYVQFHWKLDLGDRLWPAVNKGELALLYAVLFLFVAARGGGSLSLDRRLPGRTA